MVVAAATLGKELRLASSSLPRESIWLDLNLQDGADSNNSISVENGISPTNSIRHYSREKDEKCFEKVLTRFQKSKLCIIDLELLVSGSAATLFRFSLAQRDEPF